MGEIRRLLDQMARLAVFGKEEPGRLGLADGTLYYSDALGTTHYDRLWVTMGDSSEVVAVCTTGAVHQWGLPVIVGQRGGLPVVLRTDWAQAQRFTGGRPVGAGQHAWLHNRLGPDPLFLGGLQVPILVQPTRPASMAVHAPDIYYVYGGTRKHFAAADSASLAGYVPSNELVQHFAIVCLDRENNTLAVVDGADSAAGSAYSPKDRAVVPFDASDVAGVTIPAAYWPLVAIRFYSGQTAVQLPDIWLDAQPRAGEHLGGGTDANAIHDNVAGEINALSAVTSIDASDAILMESAASSYQKRKLTGEVLTNSIFSASATGSALYIRNNSGAAASAGDVGFVKYDSTYGLVYETTTTAGKHTDQFALVFSGGASGANIYVLTRAHTHTFAETVYVNYTGTAPSTGDFLITSTTAGKAQRQAYASPGIFAVCVANGSGGVVSAQLLMNRTRKPLASDNDILRINAASAFVVSGDEWAGIINDASPASSPVTVSTTQGVLTNITPVSSGEHGHIVIHNLTRGNEALVSSISGSDITFVSDAPLSTWVNGDSLTSASQTITGAGIARDIDLSPSPVLPSLTVELGITGVWRDTGGIENLDLHPYEPYANSKSARVRLQVANVFTEATVSLPLIAGRFGVRNSASGAGTGLLILRYSYVVEATP